MNKMNLQNCEKVDLFPLIKAVTKIHSVRRHYLAVYLKGVSHVEKVDLYKFSSPDLLFWSSHDMNSALARNTEKTL